MVANHILEGVGLEGGPPTKFGWAFMWPLHRRPCNSTLINASIFIINNGFWSSNCNSPLNVYYVYGQLYIFHKWMCFFHVSGLIAGG